MHMQCTTLHRKALGAYLGLYSKATVLRVRNSVLAGDWVGRLELVTSIELQPRGSCQQLQLDAGFW